MSRAKGQWFSWMRPRMNESRAMSLGRFRQFFVNIAGQEAALTRRTPTVEKPDFGFTGGPYRQSREHLKFFKEDMKRWGLK